MDEATDEQPQDTPITDQEQDATGQGLNPGGLDTDGGGAEDPEFGQPEGPDGDTSPAHFEQLSQAVEGSQPAALSLLYDLDLPVAIELGRTRLSVQDVLGLARGSVVQLDRQAGEPVDVYVGDRRFAEGEVVIVGEQFGIRITRIVNTAAVAAVSGV